MSEIRKIIEEILRFRDERAWAQFHNPKDLSLAISIEAAELLELFLWKSPEEADRARISEELADVLIYSLLFAEECGIDVKEAIAAKMEKNRLKYPVELARGSAKKYSDYGA